MRFGRSGFPAPALNRRNFLAIAGAAAGNWSFPAFAENGQNPLAQALAVWTMAGADGAGRHPVALTRSAEPPLVLGERLDGGDRAASLRRGGDGRVAVHDIAPVADFWSNFDSDNKANLSAAAELVRPLRPQNSAVSFYARVQFEGETGWGTLFYSDFLGLALHHGGLAIAFVGQRTRDGVTYRELPLCVIERGPWLDLVLRIDGRRLQFFCNGTLRATVPIARGLGVPFEDELLIGAFPGILPLQRMRSFRLGHARIDTIALWDFALSDAQVQFLSGGERLRLRGRRSPADRAIAAYNRFHDASQARDLAACHRLHREMRALLRRDPTRPIYHLTAPMGWIYDPSGAFHHQGRYHVSSYRNIYAILRFNSLDHYVSNDLVHWTSWPIGPFADRDFDAGGIWLSNHFIDDEGLPNIVYCAWSNRGETGIRARSHDGMVSFTDKKVILPRYHDGYIWKEGDTWLALTMRRPSRKTGPEIVIFSSPDLEDWTERGVLFRPADHLDQIGAGMEFPYLVNFGDKDVLMSGFMPIGVLYWVGRFDRTSFKFIPDHAEGRRIDYGNPFHCFNPTAVDDKGPNGAQRRIVMALYPGLKGAVDGVPWAGVHAMPRALSFDGEYLRQDPLPEFEALRADHQSFEGIEIPPGTTGHCDIRGDALEIIAEFDRGTATRFGLKLRLSADGKTFARAFYDTASNQFGLDGNISRGPILFPTAGPDPKLGSGPSFLADGEIVRMRLFLDKALIELFVNGQTCTTSLDDTDPLHDGLDLFSEGGPARCRRLDIWRMKGAF